MANKVYSQYKDKKVESPSGLNAENLHAYFDPIGMPEMDNFLKMNSAKPEMNAEGEHNSLTIFDTDWIDGSFVAPLDHIPYKEAILTQRAFFKFKSTRIGGNVAVNMPAGNNYLADPFASAGAALSGIKTRKGYSVTDGITYGPCFKYTALGRWYSENIDDYTQTVIFQFGVAEFNSIFSFLANSCSAVDSYIARTGVIPDTMILAKEAADIVRVIAMPICSLIVWSLKLGYTLLTGNKPFSYYYLKPAMNLYWAMVNDIANYFAVKLGMTGYNMSSKGNEALNKQRAEGGGGRKDGATVTGRAFELDKKTADMLNELYHGDESGLVAPMISAGNNFIDVHDLVTRRSYLFNETRRKFMEQMEGLDKGEAESSGSGAYKFKDDPEEDNKTVMNFIKDMITSNVGDGYFGIADSASSGYDLKGSDGLKESLSIATTSGVVEKEKEKKPADEKASKDEKSAGTFAGAYDFAKIDGMSPTTDKNAEGMNNDDYNDVWDYAKLKLNSSLNNFVEGFKVSARGYSSRAVFAVNPTGSTTDTFSNTTSSIGTGDQVKNLSKTAHDYRFNLAGGQTGFDSIDGVLDKIYQVGAGVLESWSFGISNIVNGLLMGGGFAEIPEKWDDSSFNGNSVTYTMDLVAPYGNDHSRFHNLYVPLAMILAGALPRGIGKAGYQSPFICSCYSKGTQNISLGIITDLSITSGITNQQFVLGMKTNSIKVTFTVKDLCTTMAAKVNTSSVFGEYKPVFEDDTPMSRWINRITSMEYEDLAFVLPRIKNNLKVFGNQMSNVYSAKRLGHNLGNSFFEIDPVFYKNPQFSGFGKL